MFSSCLPRWETDGTSDTTTTTASRTHPVPQSHALTHGKWKDDSLLEAPCDLTLSDVLPLQSWSLCGQLPREPLPHNLLLGLGMYFLFYYAACLLTLA